MSRLSTKQRRARARNRPLKPLARAIAEYLIFENRAVVLENVGPMRERVVLLAPNDEIREHLQKHFLDPLVERALSILRQRGYVG